MVPARQPRPLLLWKHTVLDHVDFSGKLGTSAEESSKMTEIIEQNCVNRADFNPGSRFVFLPDQYFQLMASPILNPKIPHEMQNQRKSHFSSPFI